VITGTLWFRCSGSRNHHVPVILTPQCRPEWAPVAVVGAVGVHSSTYRRMRAISGSTSGSAVTVAATSWSK
jgi:hypothetical protein